MPAHALLALVALLSLFSAACESDQLMSDLFGGGDVERGFKRSAPEPLPLGSWKSDSLHCEAGRCERWYELRVEQSGTLKIDLYAPAGSGLPECEMKLETSDGVPVSARTGRVRTQRRLRYETQPARYRLRIISKGDRGLFDYEIFAQLSQERVKRTPAAAPSRPPPKKPRARPEIPVARRPPPVVETETLDAEAFGAETRDAETDTTDTAADLEEPTSPEAPVAAASAPEPEAVWIVAEVLDVEETAGVPSAVMIEAGEPDGVEAGMLGELFEGDEVIGQIEIVDVYPTGSRARIVGPLSAPVSFDTFSRIRVPPDGE